MTFRNFFTYAAMVFVSAFGFVACGDDNDEPGGPSQGGNGDGNQPSVMVPNPSQIFTSGLPTSFDGYKVIRNSDGLVSEMVDESSTSYKFIYEPISRSTDFDMYIEVSYNKALESTLYVQLDEHGYASYVLQVMNDEEKSVEEWWFGYNDAGQLNYMKRSENDNEEVFATYKDGDLVQIDEKESGEARELKYTVAYTSDYIKTPIANKGCIMLFDEVFNIDMDEMEPAYYAGLLGKATKNLPASVRYNGQDNYWSTDYYDWTLNSAGLPLSYKVKTISSGNYESDFYEGLNFTW